MLLPLICEPLVANSDASLSEEFPSGKESRTHRGRKRLAHRARYGRLSSQGPRKGNTSARRS